MKLRTLLIGSLLLALCAAAVVHGITPAQDQAPPKETGKAQKPADQKEEKKEEKKKELYGNMPEDLEPFGSYVKDPYKKYFVPSDAAVTFWGPGRDKPEPDVPTVKLGLLAPIERSHESYIGRFMLQGAQLAVEEANAAGGFRSKPFELAVRNDSGLWGATANEIVSFTYEDHVWAVIGTVDGANTHIAIRVALRTDMPMMNVADLDATLVETRIPWIFRNAPDDRQMAYTIAYYVYKQLGLSKVAILRANNRYGRFGVAQFRKSSIRLGKPAPIEVNYEINYNRIDTNFDMQMERLLAAQPDGIILWADAEPAGLLVRKLREKGLKIPVVACERVINEKFLEAAGPAAEGVVATSPYNPDSDNPKLAAFRKSYQRKFGEPPGVYAAFSYDGTWMVIEAVRKAGLNRYRIRDALADQNHWQGVTGEVLYDDVYTNRRPVTSATVRDGRWVYGIPKLDQVF